MQTICVEKQKFLLIPPFEEVYKTSSYVASGGNGRASVVWSLPQDTERPRLCKCKSSPNSAVRLKLGPQLVFPERMQLPQQKNA